MTSQHSRRLLAFTNFGAHLKYFPYFFNLRPQEEMMSVDPHTGLQSSHPYQKWGSRNHQFLFRVLSSYSLFFDAGFILVGVWYDQTRDLPPSLKFPFYYFAITISMFMGLQLAVWIFAPTIEAMNNTFWLFNLKLYQVHKLNQWDRDGTEPYLKAMIIVIVFLIATFPFGAIAMGANNLSALLDSGLLNFVVSWFCDEPMGKGDFLTIKWTQQCANFSPDTKATLEMVDKVIRVIGWIGTAPGCTYIFLGGLSYIFHFSSMAMLYMTGIFRCMHLCTFNPAEGESLSARKKYEYIKLYMALQLMHAYMMEVTNRMTLLGIGGAAGILITTLVTLICFSHKIHPMLIFIACGAVIMTFLITQMLFRMATIITETSEELINSYLRNDRALPPAERLSLRSCRALETSAGNLFVLTRHTYITFVYDVVFDTVINIVIDINI